MILVGWGKYRWWWILLELVLITAAASGGGLLMYFGLKMGPLTILIWEVRIVVVLLFVVFGWREVGELFRRHDRRMGTGLGRVWAVARTTMREAWAGRIWLLPVMWFGAGMLMVLATRPFDESERIPLYIKALLSSQEALVMVMMWVMACVSLPKERERKILVTNASKPLSRLEIALGKITGLSVAAGLSLLAMGAVTLVILEVSDMRLRGRAAAAYALQVKDYKANQAPVEALKQLSEEGSLHAYNYKQVGPEGMNLGLLGFAMGAENPTVQRFFIGGTSEKAEFRFAPRLEVPDVLTLMPAGARPYFTFRLPWREYPVSPDGSGPKKVQVRVSAYASGPWARQEKILTLNDEMMAQWEPDQPEQLYTTYDTNGQILVNRGVVTVEVTCLTPGVLMQILEKPEFSDPNVDFNIRVPAGMAPVAPNVPEDHPRVRGFVRRSRQDLAAAQDRQPTPEMAIYRFPRAMLRDVPVDGNGNFKLALQLETFKADNSELPTTATLAIRSMDRPREPVFEKSNIEVREKRVMVLDIPATALGNSDPSKRGDMLVTVFCSTPGHSVSVMEDSVRIELPATPFPVNLLKSELVIFVETVLLIALAVTCSVRVGWPVAMFASGVCYLFGYFVNFIMGLEEAGLGALNYHVTGQEKGLIHVFDQAFSVLGAVLGFIASLVPQFNDFEPQTYIVKLQNMPWTELMGDMGNAVGFGLPIVALAYLLFRKQELG